MAFNLRVDFSGLCLYVEHPTEKRAAILMPDARKLPPKKGPHEDGSKGEPHVGYVQFDLADTGVKVPKGTERLQFQVVRRFNNEELEFVVAGSDQPLTLDLLLPKFEEFAPDPAKRGRSLLVLKKKLFEKDPPGLLMRTILTEGTLTGKSEEAWFIANLFNPGAQAYSRSFTSEVTWRRRVESVSLRFKPFDGSPVTEVPLAPPTGSGSSAVVRLKIANFCNINPMEWRELGLRQVGEDDVDFKWLYRLLEGRNKPLLEELKGHRLPIPQLMGERTEGVEDCLGAHIISEFP